MAVIVGSARSDERGKAYGGKAGDQTGRELSTQPWYKHSKGWRVLRCKVSSKADDMAWSMERACDNRKIGYDQYQRLTLYTQAEKVGFDISKVTTACETDCSALVRVCMAYAGIMVRNFRTTDQAKIMLETGMFMELTGDKYTKQSSYLRRGDVLVTRTQGHTVIVLTDGDKVDGDELPSDEKPYKRDLKNGMAGTDVLELQEQLMELGFPLPKYGADGDFGEETLAAVMSFQARYRLEVDGIVGESTRAALLDALGADEDEPVDNPALPVEKPPEYLVDFLDLSSHNSAGFKQIDWKHLRETVGFLVLRAGCTREKTTPKGIGGDSHFKRFADSCEAFGIPYWAYYYSKAKSPSDARKEAVYLCEVVQSCKPVGLCLDAEEACLTRDIIGAFYDELSKRWKGKTMIYEANHRRKKYNIPVDAEGFPTGWGARWTPFYGKNDGQLHKQKVPPCKCDAVQGTSVYAHKAIPDKTVDANFITGQRRDLRWFRGED